MPSTSLISSIQRGLQILEAFTPASPRMRLHEVVNRTGLPKVTVLRFLRTLTALKYIVYARDSKLYSLSPRVMSLGYTALSGMDVRAVALPFLEQLSEATGQTVELGILDGVEVVYIERIKKRQILNIDLEVGTRLKAYKTSMGLAIIANMEKSESRAIVEQILGDPEVVMELESMGQQIWGQQIHDVLEQVRIQGYAHNDRTCTKGLRAIAAPVFDHKGNVDAAVNIPVFANQMSKEELIEQYVPLIVNAAAEISAALGFHNNASIKYLS